MSFLRTPTDSFALCGPHRHLYVNLNHAIWIEILELTMRMLPVRALGV